MKVRKEMRGLTDAAWRREAARRMGVDYDTFLKAWKKPTVKPVEVPPLTPAPAPVVPAPVKITKHSAPAKDISHYSSNLKSTVKTATEIKQDGETIGYIQKAVQGFYEMDNRIRTGRFIIERRGYVALDKNGNVIKEGFNALQYDADSALAMVKRKAAIKPPDTLPKPAPVEPPPVKPVLSYDTARAQAKQVKKEFPTYTEAQVRREAARRMNVDYDTYLRAWKKPPKAATEPAPPVVRVPDYPKTKTPQAPAKPGPWKRKGTRTPEKLKIERVRVGGENYRGTYYNSATNEKLYSVQSTGSGEFSVYANNRLIKRGIKSFDEAEQFALGIHRNGLPDHLAVNPGFVRVPGTTMNCTSCTTSWELRRRGYDVVARTMPSGQPLSQVLATWGIREEHLMIKTRFNDPASLGNIHDWLTISSTDAVPDGARGFMTVIWKRGGSHIFNWEKRNGKVWYIDAQSGEEFSRYPHGSRALDDVNVVRVDEIPEHEMVDWLTSDTGQKPAGQFPGWRR